MTDPAKSRVGRALDWALRDRTTGAVTIAQRPNLSLWLFLGLFALAWLADARSWSSAASWLRLGANLMLAWWAADEALRGVNPWRRFLGASVLLYLGARLVAAWAA